MISAGEWVRLAALYDFDAWTFLLGVGTDKITAFMQPNIVPSNPANVWSLAAASCSSAIRSKGSWHIADRPQGAACAVCWKRRIDFRNRGS